MVAYPLVSIPLITYNSSEYIIEGLESVKSQTYKNIELIISDDCSTDDTVDLCQKWIEDNKEHFKRAVILTADKNTGVAGNLNRAIKACNGEWIKPLSGDDKFLPYTIEKYVTFLLQNPKCNIAFAKLKMFRMDQESVQESIIWYKTHCYSKIKIKDNGYQKKQNLICLFVPGPGLIYRKSLWNQIGGFDERYQFCEEDPFMYNIFNLGEVVFFIDEELYGYRISSDSLCRNNDKIISIHLKDRIRFFRQVRRKALIKNGMFMHAYEETISYKYLEYKEAHKNIQARLLILLHPRSLVKILKKITNLFVTVQLPFLQDHNP